MKAIKLGLIALCGMTVASCSDDFLDLNPPTAIPTEEYYTSVAHLQELLVTAYTPNLWDDWNGSQYCHPMMVANFLGDDAYPGGEKPIGMENWTRLFNYEGTAEHTLSGIWSNAYNSVRRANYVHEYMQYVEDYEGNEEAMAKMIAEAKVLRAYAYSKVWKFYGDAPYYTTNLKVGGIALEKSPADDVYAGIMKDLEDVLEGCTVELENGVTLTITPKTLGLKAEPGTEGRVNRAVAGMLYAECALIQNDNSRYGKALGYMNEIINSGNYSLFPDPKTMWDEENEWNSEIIFAINYFHTGASRSWGNVYYAGGNVFSCMMAPDGGCTADGLTIDSGWGFNTVRQDAYDAFEAGDLRREASIIDARDPNAYDHDARFQDTGLWNRKYAARKGYNDGQIADAQLNYGNDYVIYRYAETLLNAAELILRGAGAGDAQGMMDQVRTRAGLASVPATLDNILNERRFEFFGEGKRYFDVVRFGKAAATFGPDPKGYRTNTWSEARRYVPIPQAEINSSDGALTQNPNY